MRFLIYTAPVLVLVTAAGVVAEQAMPVNPGFEHLEGARPANWQVYVMPMPGAYAQLSEQSRTGRFAVVIHNPKCYENEPVNNWSQNLGDDLAGKKVRLAGYIKTRKASEAGLWLQCWRSSPLRLVECVTTSNNHPISGTRDWTRVSVETDVPPETDFAVVRCILTGEGTAWFDDLSVELLQKDKTEATAKDGEKKDKHKDLSEIDQVTQTLVEANRALADTIEALRDTHKATADQIRTLQEQIEQLREQLAGQSPPVAPAEIPRKQAPPLVPQGHDWRLDEW